MFVVVVVVVVVVGGGVSGWLIHADGNVSV